MLKAYKEKCIELSRNPMAMLGIGVAAGLLLVVGIRFVTFQDDSVHYHANFALYINGDQDDFDDSTFFEEVQACHGDHLHPRSRVHMHDSTAHVVHVHASSVTWGHFFENLGYGLTDTALVTDEGAFVDNEGGNLTFILNGEKVVEIANRQVEDEDVLLISYGDEDDDDVMMRFDSIPTDAHEYNEKQDPGSCAGSQEVTFLYRLKYAFGINQKSE